MTEINLAEVDRLSRKYGIDREVLTNKLRAIAYGVPTVANMIKEQPNAKDLQRRIATMRNSAASLLNSLGSIPLESSMLNAALNSALEFNIRTFKEDLQALIDALDMINPSCWKQNSDVVFRDALIINLSKFWGRKLERPLQGKPYTDFLVDAAHAMGFDGTPLPDRLKHVKRQCKGTAFDLWGS
jgi:hypothetical protein